MFRSRTLAALVLFATVVVAGCKGKKVEPTSDTEPNPQQPDPKIAGFGGESAKVEDRNRLRKIALAVLNFESAYGYMPAGVAGAKGVPALSWRVQILPFLEDDEAQRLANQFKMEEPWDGEHNKPLLAKMPKVFASVGKPAPEGKTYLRSFAGESALIRMPFPPNVRAGSPFRGRPVAGITDGTSNTLAVVEAAEPVEWTKPEELPFDGFIYSPKPPAVPKLGGVFPGGFHGLMADGSVHFFPDTLKEETLRAMISVDGGELLPVEATSILFPPKAKGPGVPTSVPDMLPDAVARKTAVANYQKILLALHTHHDINNYLPVGIVGPNRMIGLSWRVQVLPFLGEEALWKQFKLHEPWDSEHNKKLLEKMPAVFASPGKGIENGHTFIRTTFGPGGIIRTNPGPKGEPVIPIRPDAQPGTPVQGTPLISGVPDGLSNTILFVEAGEAVPWTKPDELLMPSPFDPKGGGPVLEAKLPPLGGPFTDGFHAVMGDGRITFYRTGYPSGHLAKLFCPNDGWIVVPLGEPEKIAYSIPLPGGTGDMNPRVNIPGKGDAVSKPK